MSGIGKWILLAAGAMLAALTLALSALAFASYNHYVTVTESETLSPDSARVSIGQPLAGSALPSHETVLVSALAAGPQEFSGIELWVDGELLGFDEGSPSGASALAADFFWRPTSEGAHSLIARAVVDEGTSFTSAVVSVEVVADEAFLRDEEDPGVEAAVYPAAAEGGGSTAAGPPAGSSAGPASAWNDSVGDWVQSLLPGTPPPAPELAAEADGCAARLMVHDQSDSESGFRIYRQSAATQVWQQVALLEGQSQTQWIETADLAGIGVFAYYVSAFNAHGSADSNLAHVQLDGSDCPEIQYQGLRTISTQVTDFFPGQQSEGAYCYYSSTGQTWSRWPEQGFVIPGEGFAARTGPLSQTIVPSAFEDQMLAQIGGFMECWNWQDGGLQELGSFEFIPTGDDALGQYEAIDDGEMLMKMTPSYELGPSWPLMGTDLEASAGIDLDSIEYMYRPDMSTPYLSQTTNRLECAQHLPLADDASLHCLEEATEYAPYLLWSTDSSQPTCIGAPVYECKSYADFLDLADENGGSVWFNVHDVSSAGEHVWTVSARNALALTAPALQCSGTRTFWVQMLYQPGDEALVAGEATNDFVLQDIEAVALGETEDSGRILSPLYFESRASNAVSVPCPPPPLEQVPLNVTFSSLNSSRISDFDATYTITDLEIFGYLRIEAPALGHVETLDPFFPGSDPQTVLLGARRYINIAKWNEQHSDCADDASQTFSTPEQGCTQTIQFSTYPIADWYTCRSSSKHSCRRPDRTPTSFMKGNDTVFAIVEEGDAVTIEVKFIDWDDGSDNDLYCEDSIVLAGRPLEEWAEMEDHPFTLSDSTDSGDCLIEGTISALQ